jgi:hypothetical protein
MQSAFSSSGDEDEEKRVTLMRIERMDKHITTTKRNNERLMALCAFVYVLLNL